MGEIIFLKDPVVETQQSSHNVDEFSEYENLAAAYRNCLIQCQASIDQLRAAERELRAACDKHQGEIGAIVPTEIRAAPRQDYRRNNTLAIEAIKSLSHRERNVFELIGQGLSTGAISDCLNIAVSTVETYRERLKTKLNLSTGLELTRFAILWFAKE
jgi:DNA-binding NarL/FixJ family response regulator